MFIGEALPNLSIVGDIRVSVDVNKPFDCLIGEYIDDDLSRINSKGTSVLLILFGILLGDIDDVLSVIMGRSFLIYYSIRVY